MTAGQEFVKRIRPIGAALFLIVFALFLLICFTAGRDPVPGYEAPQDSDYYAEHLSELQIELEDNLFPQLNGISAVYENDGRLVIEITDEGYVSSRAAILQYYDASLFTFVRLEAEQAA